MAELAKSRCPVCNAARVEKYRPFCSRRCADVDLGRWFTGSYAIPTQEFPEEPESVLGRRDDEEDDY